MKIDIIQKYSSLHAAVPTEEQTLLFVNGLHCDICAY